MPAWRFTSGSAAARAVFSPPREALEREPCLAQPRLSGAAVYDDARVDDSRKAYYRDLAGCGCHGAVIANHVDARSAFAGRTGLRALPRGPAFRGASSVRASTFVNASGPWAERLASRLVPGQKQARLTASKGIHMLAPPLSRSSAIAVSGKGEHGFVMPWKGMSLVGTTDDAFTGDAAAAPPSRGGNRQP